MLVSLFTVTLNPRFGAAGSSWENFHNIEEFPLPGSGAILFHHWISLPLNHSPVSGLLLGRWILDSPGTGAEGTLAEFLHREGGSATVFHAPGFLVVQLEFAASLGEKGVAAIHRFFQPRVPILEPLFIQWRTAAKGRAEGERLTDEWRTIRLFHGEAGDPMGPGEEPTFAQFQELESAFRTFPRFTVMGIDPRLPVAGGVRSAIASYSTSFPLPTPSASPTASISGELGRERFLAHPGNRSFFCQKVTVNSLTEEEWLSLKMVEVFIGYLGLGNRVKFLHHYGWGERLFGYIIEDDPKTLSRTAERISRLWEGELPENQFEGAKQILTGQLQGIANSPSDRLIFRGLSKFLSSEAAPLEKILGSLAKFRLKDYQTALRGFGDRIRQFFWIPEKEILHPRKFFTGDLIAENKPSPDFPGGEKSDNVILHTLPSLNGPVMGLFFPLSPRLFASSEEVRIAALRYLIKTLNHPRPIFQFHRQGHGLTAYFSTPDFPTLAEEFNGVANRVVTLLEEKNQTLFFPDLPAVERQDGRLRRRVEDYFADPQNLREDALFMVRESQWLFTGPVFLPQIYRLFSNNGHLLDTLRRGPHPTSQFAFTGYRRREVVDSDDFFELQFLLRSIGTTSIEGGLPFFLARGAYFSEAGGGLVPKLPAGAEDFPELAKKLKGSLPLLKTRPLEYLEFLSTLLAIPGNDLVDPELGFSGVTEARFRAFRDR